MNLPSRGIVPSPTPAYRASKTATSAEGWNLQPRRYSYSTNSEIDRLEASLSLVPQRGSRRFSDRHSDGPGANGTTAALRGCENGSGVYRSSVSVQLEDLKSGFYEMNRAERELLQTLRQAENSMRDHHQRWLLSVEQWLLQQQQWEQQGQKAGLSNPSVYGVSERSDRPPVSLESETATEGRTVESRKGAGSDSDEKRDDLFKLASPWAPAQENPKVGEPVAQASPTLPVLGGACGTTTMEQEAADDDKGDVSPTSANSPKKDNINDLFILAADSSFDVQRQSSRWSRRFSRRDRKSAGYWVQTMQADVFFGFWIMLNAFAMAVEADYRTDYNEDHVGWLIMDSVFNVVFLVEVCLRMHAQGRAWIREAWNILDFFMVAIGVIDTWLIPLLQPTGSSADLRIVTLMRLVRLLKLIRVLRLIRLVSFLKELRFLVLGMIQAFRATIWGLLMLVMIIFMGALLLTKLVGKQCCSEEDLFATETLLEYFGSMPKSAFTLFQFTMEFQPDIVRETWQDGLLLTLFLIAYTALTHIMLLNMMSSVIVDSILQISRKEDEMESHEKAEKLQEETLKRLMTLFEDFDSDKSGYIEQREFDLTGANPERQEQILATLRKAGITYTQASELFQVLDIDESGSLNKEEFVRGFMRMKGPPQSKHILKVECQVGSMLQKLVDMQKNLSTLMNRYYPLPTEFGGAEPVKERESDSFRHVLSDGDASIQHVRSDKHGRSSLTLMTAAPSGKALPAPPCPSSPARHGDRPSCGVESQRIRRRPSRVNTWSGIGARADEDPVSLSNNSPSKASVDMEVVSLCATEQELGEFATRSSPRSNGGNGDGEATLPNNRSWYSPGLNEPDLFGT